MGYDAIIIVCSIVAVLGFLGYFLLNRSLENYRNEKGVYPVGGFFGKQAEEFLSTHPVSNRVYNKVLEHGFTEWNELEIKSVLELGACAFIKPKYVFKNVIIVVPGEMIFAFGKSTSSDSTDDGKYGQIFCGKTGVETFSKCFTVKGVQDFMKLDVTVPGKEKSVIGHAVAGGVIAGGAGAVVGAISAASHNSKVTSTTETRYVPYGNNVAWKLRFSYHCVNPISYSVDDLFTLENINIDDLFEGDEDYIDEDFKDSCCSICDYYGVDINDTVDGMKHINIGMQSYDESYAKLCKALVLKMYQNNMTKDITEQSSHRISLLDD